MRYGEDYWTPQEAENGYAPGDAVFTEEGVWRVPMAQKPCPKCGGGGGWHELDVYAGTRWKRCPDCDGSGYDN